MLTNKVANRQTNNDDYISSMEEVVDCWDWHWNWWTFWGSYGHECSAVLLKLTVAKGPCFASPLSPIKHFLNQPYSPICLHMYTTKDTINMCKPEKRHYSCWTI